MSRAAIRLAAAFSAVMQALLLAAVGLLDRPEPAQMVRRVASTLTVKETCWGRCTWPACHYWEVVP